MVGGTGGPIPYQRRNKAERAQLAEIVFDLRIQGLSFYAIDALTSDPDGPTGGQRIAATTARDLVRQEIERRVDPKIDEYRALELARLEAQLERLHNMEQSVRAVMGRKHITVSNGRVIRAINPDSGEEEPVEDDTFILHAIDRLNRIEESRRRTSESIRLLLGLNMPVKVDATVTETTQQDLELQEILRNARAAMQLEEQQIVNGGDGEA
ncbi:hypothetical protein [Streptomyces sp. NRRL S-813]|uniref:hypothetical protein n=1 Tax=Streptomyces sp. NRRL S-813 TaxID=1463919 RepID=UPI0004C0D26B|nr:hypothetical protein [Streptomyces sp. NRRL S-813]